MSLIKRNIEDKLFSTLNKKELSILVGPRQVGKSTLLKQIARRSKKKFRFLNLEDPRDLEVFRDGYSSFIKEVSEDLVFIDEFHYYKNITSVFKAVYDLNPEKKIFASGSSSIEIHKHLKESLAGRRTDNYIYSLSFSEFLSQFDLSLPQLDQVLTIKNHDLLSKYFYDFLKYGSMPFLIKVNTDGLYGEEYQIEVQEKLYGIYKTYIATDIKTFLKDESILNFNKLVEYFVINDSELLAVNSIAQKLNIPESQIKKQLEVMTETFTLGLLRPFFRNKTKEISKLSKSFFYDLGIANAINNDFRDFRKKNDKAKGAILENFVFWELKKSLNIRYRLNFWRNYDDQEVDFILSKDCELLAIEVKSTETQIPSGIKAFIRNYPETKAAVVLSNAEEFITEYNEVPVYFYKYYRADKLKELL
jgi:uncharacterized protein